MPVSTSEPIAASAGPSAEFRLEGAWVLARSNDLTEEVRRLRALAGTPRFDASGIERLDTAGALMLLDLIGGADGVDRLTRLDPRHAGLLAAVLAADQPAHPLARTNGLIDVLASVGAVMQQVGRNMLALIGFIGLILATLFTSLLRPARWRLTPLAAQIEQTGLNAVPIVVLLTFMVGCVVAFLGATVLRDFGATAFTVELVGYSFLREFGVLLTAILVAGRSGSAFTAQLGSMKANEEIDAIRTLALDPVELLVLPRVLGLLVSMPLLSFLAVISGLLGGAAICALTLDIPPVMYFTRLNDNIDVRHFWIGLCKAPLFAFVIAAIGCLEGMKVTGSAESVGEHTTSSVVQSIFVVILIDALAAIFFMEIDW